MSDKVQISFDEDNRIRVLEADKFHQTDQLKNESLDFLKKIISYDENVNELLQVLEQYQTKIEQQKLIALGQRNKVENESDNRKNRIAEILNILHERKTELERDTATYESLQRVEQEQKALIDKLSNNEI